MKVVVLESPAKAKTIEKYLGSGFLLFAYFFRLTLLKVLFLILL